MTNRSTGMSMGEHTEITAKEWDIPRAEQDRIALESHQRALAAWDAGFFDDLVIPIGDLRRDTIPRKDTSLEKLAELPPAFDRTSGQGTLTAGNSSPLTDGAAALWVASRSGLAKLPAGTPQGKARRRLGNRRRGLSLRRPPDGAGLRDPAAARAQRPELCRHRSVGNPRGLRGAGPVPHQGARKPGVPAQARPASTSRIRPASARAREPQRRQRRHRPSVRRHRRAHPEPGGQGTGERMPDRAPS